MLLRASLFAVCLTAGMSAAEAGSAPAAACAFAGEALPTSDLVLGHFRGGRIVWAVDGAPMIVWRDEYACFTTRQKCESWQRRMLVAWRNVEGDRTCLPIR